MAPPSAKQKTRIAVAALLVSLLALQVLAPIAQALSLQAPAAVKTTTSAVGGAVAGTVKMAGAAVKTSSLAVKAPVAAVKTPSVTVKTPVATVKAPTVTVSAPIKSPSVTVKAPTVTANAPAATVKTPTITAKAPTVSAKAPSAAAKTPTAQVKAKAPSVSLKGQSVATSGAPSVRVTTTAGSTTVGVSGTGKVSAGRGGRGSTSPSVSSGSNASSGTARMGAAAVKVAAALLLAPGYGQAPGARPLDSGPLSRYGGRLSPRQRAILAHASALRATVARLQGCLSELPERGRVALQLSTGVGVSRALQPRAVAARLHVGLSRLTRIEARALRELRSLSRTHSCTSIGQAVGGVLAFIGANFAGGGEGGEAGGTGDTQLASYTPDSGFPRVIRAREPSSGGWLLGDISPVATGMLLLLILTFLAALTVAAILADSAGQGPRHWQWRRRVINRIRSLR